MIGISLPAPYLVLWLLGVFLGCVVAGRIMTRERRRVPPEVPKPAGWTGFIDAPLPVPNTVLNRELLEAVLNSEHDRVRELVEQGADGDMVAYYPLEIVQQPIAMLAAIVTEMEGRRGDPTFAYLLQFVKDPNVAEGRLGHTFLMAAVDLDDFDSVRLLVNRGADLDRCSVSPHTKGMTALHKAALSLNPKNANAERIAIYLVEQGANSNARTENGLTPLMIAARTGKRALVESMLAHGGDPTLRSVSGRDAAWLAEKGGHPEIADVLRKHRINNTDPQ